MFSSSSGSDAALSAIYDTWDDANAAARRLVDAGVPAQDVRVIPETPEAQVEGRDVGTEGGFVGALFSLFFPRDDHDAYAEAIRRGSVLVVAERVPAGLRDPSTAALDQEGAVDVEEREAAWRATGWAGETKQAGETTLRRDPEFSRGRVRSYTSS